MPVRSLREAFHLSYRNPALWLLGIAVAALGTLNLLLQLTGGMQATRLVVIQLFAIPFFIGGAIHAAHRGESSISAFIEGGKRHYWRILLATLVILFAALLTIIVLVATISLLGMGADAGLFSMMAMGVAVPFLCFTYFYDTAIVLEERRTLDAIRRSVEFVFAEPVRTLLFFVLNLAVLVILAFVASIPLAMFMAPAIEPHISANQTDLETVLTERLIADMGVVSTSGVMLVWFLALAVGVVLIYAYKVSFFKHYAGEVLSQYGVYDEKGRWYRY